MSGVVYLVGAGPGDPGLFTVRGAACLAAADVVVADHLVSTALIERWAQPDAMVWVRPAGRSGPLAAQEEINRLLVEQARSGKTVVRLKGGDPFVFGRGGEEAEALAAAGVPFEVVPGVTAAVAAPAYAGIPLTHRGLSGAVVFATGHEADQKEGGGVDWEALARGAGTLVLYMSVTRLPDLVRRLVAAGRAPTEPAAVVECGTLAQQRVVVATLGELAERASAAGVRPPALTVIGEVVRLRERIAWFERSRILLLTTKEEAPPGAGVVQIAPLRVRLLVDALAPVVQRLRDFHTVAFTSAHAVDALWAALGGDARGFAGLQLVAVGEGTAAQLRARGVNADLIADGGGAALAQQMLGGPLDGPVLVPRARNGREELTEALRAAGLTVETADAYETEPDAAELARAVALHRDRPFAAVAFTSPRGARAFLDAAGGPAALVGAQVGAIGETTRQALVECGLHVDVVANPPSVTGLVDGLRDALARGRKME